LVARIHMLLGNSCNVIFNTYYIHTPSNVHYMAKNHCAKFHDFYTNFKLLL